MTTTESAYFEYGITNLRSMKARTQVLGNGQTSVSHIEVNGMLATPTNRFWRSLQQRFGFTQNIFRYFSLDEVFERISLRNANDRLRYCLEHTNEGTKLLAVTNPSTAVATYDDLQDLLQKHQTLEQSYSAGVVRSTHSPRLNLPFEIAGDGFLPRFVIDTPIDGFGKPSIYLSLLRQICENGAVAAAATFRSELNVGRGNDGVSFALTRAMEGFNNEEGFAALRQRFESATKSWASVREVNQLRHVLTQVHATKSVRDVAPKFVGYDGSMDLTYDSSLFRAFHKMTGDLGQVYGMANLNALSTKKQRTLPSGCRVYDLLNFASELATHYANPNGARSLQAFIGSLISSEFDLEGTVDQFGDWQDFFIKDAATAQTRAEMV